MAQSSVHVVERGASASHDHAPEIGAVTANHVIDACAISFGVPAKAIRDDEGKRELGRDVATARFVAMWIAHEALGLTPKELMAAFDRKYGAVARGLERAEALLVDQEEREVRATARQVCVDLGLYKLAERLQGMGSHRQLEGLVAIHRDLPIEFFDSLATASTVDILFATAVNFLHERGHNIMRALQRSDTRIRIVLTDFSDPKNPNLHAFEKLCPFSNNAELKERVERSLNWCRSAARDLGPGTGNLLVRLQDTPPTCGMIIRDGTRALVTQYLPYTDSADDPTYEFECPPTGGVFLRFTNAFDRVWQNAQPVPGLDQSKSVDG